MTTRIPVCLSCYFRGVLTDSMVLRYHPRLGSDVADGPGTGSPSRPRRFTPPKRAGENWELDVPYSERDGGRECSFRPESGYIDK